jgi:hypothetical protein
MVSDFLPNGFSKGLSGQTEDARGAVGRTRRPIRSEKSGG